MRNARLQVAPHSAAHILKLAQLGAYNTVNFFRVDRGFVAQVTDIRGNRLVPLNREQEVCLRLPSAERTQSPDSRHLVKCGPPP